MERKWIKIYWNETDVSPSRTTTDTVEVMDLGAHTLVRNTCWDPDGTVITLAVIPCPLHEIVGTPLATTPQARFDQIDALLHPKDEDGNLLPPLIGKDQAAALLDMPDLDEVRRADPVVCASCDAHYDKGESDACPGCGSRYACAAGGEVDL